MESGSLIYLLSMALGLGMLHALDADHILAVSSLSCSQQRLKKTFHHCIKWAVGHGFAILAIGTMVLVMGMAIPRQLSHFAEIVVGIILIALGLAVFIDLRRRQLHLHFHRHHDLPRHVHWHQHHQTGTKASAASSTTHRHEHGATMVGIVHGMAGSAPLLALLPLGQWQSPYWGITYLLIFCLGVLLSMLMFGGILNQVFAGLENIGSQVTRLVRGGIGVVAIVAGSFWLQAGIA